MSAVQWPGVIFYRDCTFASVARKNEAKVIWQNIKSTLKAPKNIEEVMCVCPFLGCGARVG